MVNGMSVFVFASFIASVSQVILKTSADKAHKKLAHEYLNIRVISAYLILIVSSLLTIYAYTKVPLKLTPMLDATAYIFTPALSYFFLKEKMNLKRGFGIAVIVLGIMIFAAPLPK
jgi:drug/metabolite transporter (DMT)-like permease